MESTWGRWKGAGILPGRGTLGVDAIYDSDHLQGRFGAANAKSITDGPQALIWRWRQSSRIQNSDPHFLAWLVCLLTCLPASSPFLDLSPSCVTSRHKNHQWRHTACRLVSGLLLLVFRDPVSCVILFLSSLPPFPIGARYARASWNMSQFIPLRGLVCHSRAPLLCWEIFQLSEPHWNVVSYGMPSLILPQQQQPLPSLALHDTFHNWMWFLSVIRVPQLLQDGDHVVPSLGLITHFCVWYWGNVGRTNFSTEI